MSYRFRLHTAFQKPRKIEITYLYYIDCGITYTLTFFPFIKMDYSYERRKKSDKAKDKACRPSSKHVRHYEALQEHNKFKTKPKQQK